MYTPMSAGCVARLEGEETSACIIYFDFIPMVEKVTRVERYIYFETLEGMVEEKMGRLGSGGQLIFHPMYAVGDPPSYFRNDRPPSIRPICYRIRPDTREIHL